MTTPNSRNLVLFYIVMSLTTVVNVFVALERQMSADSISSLNSMSSIGSGASTDAKKKAKKNWVCNYYID